MSLVLPGDPIPLASSTSITLGPGIAASSSRVTLDGPGPVDTRYIATRAGLLRSSRAGKEKAVKREREREKGKEKGKGEQYWVEGSSKRYIPAPKELVLGTIIARHAEGYRVDIGSAQMATLDALAFEGATKRSKPNLKIGTLVYARVSLTSRDMDPELECFDPASGKSDGFGELKGGLMVFCSLQTCRQLLNPSFPLLPTLASQFPFETAVGLNGRIWLKAGSVSETIALNRVLEGCDAGEVGVREREVDRAVRGFLA